MKYPITQDFLPAGLNHSGATLEPVGLTIHETATPGATARNERDYFHSGDRSASAHYFVDDIAIIQLLPENLQAWHAGPTANKRYLSIEICHFADPDKFRKTWNRAVWLAADICLRHGLDPEILEQMNTHAWVSKQWGETDHTDPIGYFRDHGKLWADFVNDVKLLMEAKAVEEITIKIGAKAIKGTLQNGVSRVSVREMAEALGCTVRWVQPENAVIVEPADAAALAVERDKLYSENCRMRQLISQAKGILGVII
jgi:N-acetylmuramoyl-L-alanine amidase CwlA